MGTWDKYNLPVKEIVILDKRTAVANSSYPQAGFLASWTGK
jgi:hypothetical protein